MKSTFDSEAYQSRATLDEMQSILARCSCDKHDASKLLGLNPDSITRLARQGKIPGARIGGSWRFNPRRLMALIDGE